MSARRLERGGDLRVEALSITLAHAPQIKLLDTVSFHLPPGGRLGLVGESGCGKSLSALAIMGLLPEGLRAQGDIRLDGEPLLRLNDRLMSRLRGARMAMVFQEPMTALNPVHTIGAQIAEGPRRHLGMNRADAEAHVRQLLERVGLPASQFSPSLYPHQLSGGQRQRVVLAIALASDPDILIADEPTTALDVTVQAQILALIDEIIAERGMSLLMISHDLGVIGLSCTHTAVMYAGEIVEQAPTRVLFQEPAHPYTRGLFQAQPQFARPSPVEGHKKPRLSSIPGTVPAPQARGDGCLFAARCNRRSPACVSGRPQAQTLRPQHSVACLYPHEAG